MIGKFLVDRLFASVIPPHRVDVSLDLFEEGLSSRIFDGDNLKGVSRKIKHYLYY